MESLYLVKIYFKKLSTYKAFVGLSDMLLAANSG